MRPFPHPRRRVPQALPLATAMLLALCASAQALAATAGCSPAEVGRALEADRMPLLTGCRLDEVSGLLGTRNLQIERTSSSSSAAVDTIETQSIPAGTAFRPGVPLKLGLSDGILAQTPPLTNPTSATADVQLNLLPDAPSSTETGRPIHYGIVVGNRGPAAARRVNVSGQFSNFVVSGVSGACTRLPCDIDDIAVDSNYTIMVTGTPTSSGGFDLIMSAKAVEADPDMNNNRMDVHGTATAPPTPPSSDPAADIALSLAQPIASPSPAGQPVRFDVVLVNRGPDAAPHVNVTAKLTNFVVSEVAEACASLPCTLDDVQAGSKHIVRITGRPAATGSYDVAILARTSDPLPYRDPDSENDTLTVSGVAAAVPTRTADVTTALAVDQSTSQTPDVAGRAIQGASIWHRFGNLLQQISQRFADAAIVAVLLLVGMGGVAATSLYRWRARKHWTALLQVGATLDRQASFAIGPIALALPPLRIEVHVEPGETRASSPLDARPQEELT